MKSAVLALVTREEKGRPYLLLGKKGNAEMGTGLLNGPGGKVEHGETILQALAREVYEEAGVYVLGSCCEIVAIVDCFSQADGHYMRVMVYSTSSYSGTPRDTDTMTDFGWYNLYALPYERMHDGDRHWLPYVLDGHKCLVKLHFQSKGEGYISHKIEALPSSLIGLTHA